MEKHCKETKTLADLSVKSENGESTLSGEKNESEEINFLDSSSERRNSGDETVTSNAEEIESTTKACEDSKNPFDISSQDEITPNQGEVIRNFLKNSASQLTVYGLFCLQEGLEDRELCFFFRNNHFNTMFKVNGDTQFMTSDFKEFKIEDNHAITSIWDEIDDLNKTSLENLPNIDGPDSLATCKSDRELAITLQQDDREVQRNSRQQNQTYLREKMSLIESLDSEWYLREKIRAQTKRRRRKIEAAVATGLAGLTFKPSEDWSDFVSFSLTEDTGGDGDQQFEEDDRRPFGFF